jgi:hypothetical protein
VLYKDEKHGKAEFCQWLTFDDRHFRAAFGVVQDT